MDRIELIKRLLAQQNHRCFICEEPLDSTIHKIYIDHIIPRAKGGRDDENNYAATHEACNQSKLDSDLRIARCMARYERVKERYAQEGPNRPNLGDFLKEYGGGKYSLRALRNGSTLAYTFPEQDAATYQAPIIKDKLSGMEYTFLHLPIEYIHHDRRINPKGC